nr:thioredoxin-disulfide reductase [Actinospica acidiphila]
MPEHRPRVPGHSGNAGPLGSVGWGESSERSSHRSNDARPETRNSAVSDVRNVIIIGSGPAGYTAALYTARASLKPLVFEGAVTAGGALMNTTDVENFPGFQDGIMGPELMDNMRGQAERFGAELVPDDVVAVDLTGEIKTVTDTAGTVHKAKAVIVTTGSQHRKLGLPNEDALSGRGVSWCATCDGFFFKDQDIAVIGGGDTAMEEATFLSRFAKSVTIVHRRDTLRASKAMQERAFADPKISFVWDSEVAEILGDQKLSGLKLRNVKTGELSDLAATGLFIAIGHDPRTELFKGQLELDEEGYLKVDAPSTRTNVTGVFAAGDVVDHTYRQAITAAGTGCSAALDAERFLAALADEDKAEPEKTTV